jgi:alkylhydroperoxidase/carboxymuconolactone decarboxylase family protein YurZ
MMPALAPSREVGVVPVAVHEEILRRLSIRDDAYVASLLTSTESNVSASRLDAKTHSLVRLGALIAIDAAPPSYMEAIETARASGASSDEIVGTLVAALPAVGVTRVVSAAPKLGLALGYDVAAALEVHDGPPHVA